MDGEEREPAARAIGPLGRVLLVAWIVAALLVEWMISGGIGWTTLATELRPVGALSRSLQELARTP
jgi:hypothetical protein